jgi:hypothetical protein
VSDSDVRDAGVGVSSATDGRDGLVERLGDCWPDSPVAPERDSLDVGVPRFNFTGGTAKVLGSTNQGELVEIDLDAGTATLIGDAGIFAGDSVGWTDIAFDGSGTLFGLSRIFFESDFEVHLYRIDPSTGAIIADIGSAGDHAFSDFDYDGSDFYGNGKEDVFGCCGQLFTIDVTSAQATWISSDTLGFGLNPYDTIGSSDPIQSGGFAVHPVTGDLWGIEALQFSNFRVLFRIDRTTGLADSILKVGPPEYGYDALHILDDGTFIATRGGPDVPPDSVLWEISSTPDSLGVVAIAPIPLTFDPLIVGSLNGLESPPDAEDLLVEVVCDNLAPVRAAMVDCTATASGTGETVSFEWVFRPDSITVFPGQGAPRFLPSSDVPGPSGPGADSWAGRVVTSGWIVLVGSTATPDSAQDSVHVAVQPRAGPAWETTESIIGPIQNDSLTMANHPIVNDTTRLLGANRHVDGTDLIAWSGGRDDAPLISDNGPNHGYFYVDSAGYRWERSYWLNPHITPSGPVHAVYQGQKNHWDGLLAMVPGATPQALLDGVTAHERYGAGAGAGHQGRYRDAMIGDQCGNINRLMERVVGDGPAFGTLVPLLLDESITFLLTETEETNVGNNYAATEHVLGQNPNQDNGPHVYNNTLHDTKSITHTPHSLLCN